MTLFHPKIRHFKKPPCKYMNPKLLDNSIFSWTISDNFLAPKHSGGTHPDWFLKPTSVESLGVISPCRLTELEDLVFLENHFDLRIPQLKISSTLEKHLYAIRLFPMLKYSAFKNFGPAPKFGNF